MVDPNEHSRLGSLQYPETLPLNDHEVVLTSTMVRCRVTPTACGEIAPGLERVAILQSRYRSRRRNLLLPRFRCCRAEIETVLTSLAGKPKSGLVAMPDFFMFNPALLRARGDRL